MWKRLNFCGCGSTLKKEAGSKLESDQLYTELGTEAKNILLLPHPCSHQQNDFSLKKINTTRTNHFKGFSFIGAGGRRGYIKSAKSSQLF